MICMHFNKKGKQHKKKCMFLNPWLRFPEQTPTEESWRYGGRSVGINWVRLLALRNLSANYGHHNYSAVHPLAHSFCTVEHIVPARVCLNITSTKCIGRIVTGGHAANRLSPTFLCSCRLDTEAHLLLHTEHMSFLLGSPRTGTKHHHRLTEVDPVSPLQDFIITI